MHHMILLFLFSSLFTQALAATSLKLYDPTDHKVYYKSTTTEIKSEDSDQGSTYDKPYKIYLPIANSANINYTRLSPASNLPVAGDATGNLFFKMNVENSDSGASSKNIYIATEVTAGTSYTIANSAPLLASSLNEGTYTDVAVDILIKDHLCAAPFDCSTLSSTTLTATKKGYYLFLYSGVAPAGTFNLTDAGYENGFFIEINYSNVHRDNSQIGLAINRIDPGDKSLFLEYSTKLYDTSMSELIIIKRPTSSSGVVDYQAAVVGGSIIINEENEFSPSAGGTIRLKRLDNGVDYQISIAFADKYNFVSGLTPTTEGRPMEIEQFIKSQQCYLLSAGFGRGHFVIDYFKFIRDDILSHFFLGKKMISFYYRTAPRYTKTIYTTPGLSLLVRGAAYILYYALKFFIPLCLFIFFIKIGLKLKGILLSKVENKSLTK